MPHPSGANAERISYFLGRKPRERLSAKTDPHKLDGARAVAGASRSAIRGPDEQAPALRGCPNQQLTSLERLDARVLAAPAFLGTTPAARSALTRRFDPSRTRVRTSAGHSLREASRRARGRGRAHPRCRQQALGVRPETRRRRRYRRFAIGPDCISNVSQTATLRLPPHRPERRAIATTFEVTRCAVETTIALESDARSASSIVHRATGRDQPRPRRIGPEARLCSGWRRLDHGRRARTPHGPSGPASVLQGFGRFVDILS